MTTVERIALPTVEGGWRCILADPPWQFQTWSAKGQGRSAERHYPTMSLAEIKALPVKAIAAPDCWLFLWCTSSFVALGAHIPIMESWGFRPSSIGLVWVKTPRDGRPILSDKDLPSGLGFTFRRNVELCMLGRRGNPKRLSKAVREVIMAPRYRHSEKPPEVHRRIEAFCSGPYIELFARGPGQPGWSVWGDEAEVNDGPQQPRLDSVGGPA
jgi:N6-adenosine-specific RNA methylase IME4